MRAERSGVAVEEVKEEATGRKSLQRYHLCDSGGDVRREIVIVTLCARKEYSFACQGMP